ncbi:BON domain-containing protein [Vibrio algarum]|uniref:BON domain-containing protein n=1 Tax=Vibrio algarum TaxID=3020714 RepID=A0ABT4YPL3_9VIBR|nr:BON domain-containing protein [Vibrio sp. KJ40-1]MDB1122984.1 BON domain-containing protein [Vibrio sp. KJ40-1]
MNKVRFLLIPILSILLTGCAGLFLAGAATAVYVVTDPRDSRELATDQDISLQVGALGNKSPYQFNVRVTANTFKGNVLLMGQAVSQDLKDSVEAEVRKLKGVNVVYNQMKVKPLLSIGAVSKDTWITTKVKSSIIADDELREIKVTVYTEDTEVFLTGAVSPYHADKAVDIARNISGVSKVIRAFYYGEEPAAKEVQQEQKQEIQAEVITVSETQAENTVIEEDVPFIAPIEE